VDRAGRSWRGSDLAQILHDLRVSRDEHSFLLALSGRVRELTDADRVFVARLSAVGRKLSLSGAPETPGEQGEQVVEYVESDPLLRSALGTGTTQWLPAPIASSPLASLLAVEAEHSVIVVPIVPYPGRVETLLVAILSHEISDAVRAAVAEAAVSCSHAVSIRRTLQRSAQMLPLLRAIAQYSGSPEALAKLIHVILTGVTAGYGLGFNRAALFLTTSDASILGGSVAIGHLTSADAELDDAYRRPATPDADQVEQYLTKLDGDEIAPTTMHQQVRQLSLSLRHVESTLLQQIMDAGQPRTIEADRVPRCIPGAVVGLFQPTSPLVVAPLVANGVRLGVLFADNKFSNAPIGEAEMAALDVFLQTASMALTQNALAARHVDALKILREAGEITLRSLDRSVILDAIAEQAAHIAARRGAEVLFADIWEARGDNAIPVAAYPKDKLGKIRSRLPCGLDRGGSRSKRGVVGRALSRGEVQLVGDVAGDDDYVESHEETRSEIAVPVKTTDSVSLVINVESPQFDAFDRGDSVALELLAMQAAIAIENAEHYAELRRTRGLLDKRMVIALTAAAYASARHAQGGAASGIKVDLHNLEKLLTPSPIVASILERLRWNATRVNEVAVAEPLARAVSERFFLNEWMTEYLERLTFERLAIERVNVTRRTAMVNVDVRISKQWLRVLMDIIVDNVARRVQERGRTPPRGPRTAGVGALGTGRTGPHGHSEIRGPCRRDVRHCPVTPDDVGGPRAEGAKSLKLRARQNVVFELGFFVGRLGRSRVTVLRDPNVEIPSDYLGVELIDIDRQGGWKLTLARELMTAGLSVRRDLGAPLGEWTSGGTTAH
jgi:GAF domain-containing protein